MAIKDNYPVSTECDNCEAQCAFVDNECLTKYTPLTGNDWDKIQNAVVLGTLEIMSRLNIVKCTDVFCQVKNGDADIDETAEVIAEITALLDSQWFQIYAAWCIYYVYVKHFGNTYMADGVYTKKTDNHTPKTDAEIRNMLVNIETELNKYHALVSIDLKKIDLKCDDCEVECVVETPCDNEDLGIDVVSRFTEDRYGNRFGPGSYLES